MKRETILIALFFLITAISFYLFYQIVVPFFVPIAWAAVLVIIFFPLYEKVRPRVRSRGLASLLMCILIIVVIVGPITYLFMALVDEAADAVAKVNEMYRNGELDDIVSFNIPVLQGAKEKLSQYYDISSIDFDAIVRDAIDRVGNVIFNQTSWLIANGTRTVFYFFLMVFTMYYFFKDGQRVVNKIKRLMPLPPERIASSFGQLRDIIYATMYGGVTIAAIQGVIGGILFALVGVPSPVFWGAIMGFLSVLPMVGAFIVYVPAGLILIVSGAYIKGIVVIGIGIVVISQVDNILRPILISGISRRAEMHPLLLFFSIMGGIALFGLLGLIVGPLIAAIFITLLRVLEIRLHPDDEELPAGDELPAE